MKLSLAICFWFLLCIHMSWAWTAVGMGLCVILFLATIDWDDVFEHKIIPILDD